MNTDVKYKLLYVDDEAGNVNIFHSVYRRKFDVTTAMSGEEALGILREKGPFHLLITDQQMPQMSGTELLTASQEIDPDLVKIIITGYADLEVIKEAVNKLTLFQYVNKPLQYDDFFMVLERACTFWQLREDNKNLVQSLREVNLSLEQKVRERTEELRAERAVLDAHFNSADDMFFLLDQKSGIITLNKKADSEIPILTGKKIKIGDFFIDLMPEILRPSYSDQMNLAFSGQAGELEYRNKNGRKTRYFKVKFMPAGSEGNQIFAVSMNVSEITEMRLAELRIKSLAEMAVTSNSDLQYKNHEIEISREELRANNDQLQEQQAQLQTQHLKIQQSIRYARSIQSAVVGNIEDLQEYFPYSFVINKPRDTVSGDFYFFENTGDVKLIILGDCTGHGVPGALLTMMGHAFLTEIISEKGVEALDQILIALNDKFHKTLKTQSGEYTSDGMDIGILALNTAEKTGRFSGAHISCYTVSENKLEEYAGARFSVGMKSEMIRPIVHEFSCSEQTVFYLSSDGFRDQFGSTGKMGRKKYKELLALAATKPFAEQADFLEQQHILHKGHEEQTDDILLLGISLQSETA